MALLLLSSLAVHENVNNGFFLPLFVVPLLLCTMTLAGYIGSGSANAKGVMQNL